MPARFVNRGAGVWDHQECDGISQILAPGVGESIAGVDVGERGLQPETIASDDTGQLKGKERDKAKFELFSLEFLENRRRRFSYEQAGVEVPQRLCRIWKRKTHPTCRKSDGLLGGQKNFCKTGEVG